MELKYWAATDIGRKRADNEDNFLIDKNLHLFVVADGMGGHASGEVASALAVQTIREIVSAERDLIARAASDDVAWNLEVCILLEHAVHIACERVYQKAQQEPEKRGMGTTVVCLLIAGGRGYIAYVGDSRLYLVRGELVYQLTEDHSLMNELVRRGKIRADEFDDSPYANYQDISKILPLPEIQEVPGQLIDIANRRGGKDNITAIVVQIPRSDAGDDEGAELNYTLDMVRKVPIFADLSYPQLVRVMNMGRISPMAEGQPLCREGQVSSALQVILRGQVELSRDGTTLTALGPGQHFGEMSLIDDLPHSTTVVCTEEGKVMSLVRKDFEAILKREAPLAVKLLRRFVSELSNRLRKTNEALTEARAEAIDDISDDLAEDFEMLEEGELLSTDEAELVNGAGDTQIAGKTPDPTEDEPDSEDTLPAG
jgi:serine/threonine protein phosphatase PrpC/CRP-like cAMP-binding protein